MTPRTGLPVALVGLVVAVLCIATLILLRDWNPDESDVRVLVLSVGFGIALDLGAILGLIVMVVGLVFALKKQSVKPS